MKKFCLTACLCALLGAQASAALAQTPAQQPQGPKQVTEYDFEEDKITGEFQHHGGQMVQGELARRGQSLVSPRANFLPEMIKSAEDL